MPHREFLDWVALYQIEPFGDVRGDWQMATLASLTANINRDSKKRPKAFEPGDFVPNFWPRAQSVTTRASQVASKAMAIFGQMTGKRDE